LEFESKVTGRGNRWTRERMTALRSHRKIPVHRPAETKTEWSSG